MAHEWFREVDWAAMLAKEYSPFFVPVLKDGHDVSNFDRDFTEMEIDSLSIGSSQNRKYSDFDGSFSNVILGFSYNCEKSVRKKRARTTVKLDLSELRETAIGEEED